MYPASVRRGLQPPNILWLVLLMGAFTSSVEASTNLQASTTETQNEVNPCHSSLASKAVRMIVPFSPGGGKDLLARQLAQTVNNNNQTQVSVINMPGALGSIAARALMAPHPNVVSVGMIDPRMIVSAGAMKLDVPSLIQLSPLLLLIDEPAVWIMRDGALAHVDHGHPLLAWASEPRWRLELPAQLLNRKVVPIKGYRGTSDAWAAMMRNELDVMALTVSAAERYLSRGNDVASVWMVLASERVSQFPTVPTLSERYAELGSIPTSYDSVGASSSVDPIYQLTRSFITLAVDANLPSEIQACVSAIFQSAVMNSEFIENMRLLRIPLQLGSQGRANAIFSEILTLIGYPANSEHSQP